MRILIIGTTEDDISYIATKMEVETVDTILNGTEVFVGKYGEKDIALLYTGIGEMNAALVTGVAIEKYQPYLCINVGNVHSFDEGLKQCDLFIGTRIYLSNINQMPLGRLSYGQIPDMKPFYSSEESIVQQIKDLNSSLANMNLVRGVLISDDIFRTKPEDMNELIEKHFIKIENMVACDSSSGGVVFACSRCNVPYVCFKVCAYELGNKDQLITRQRMGLSVQPYVGKVIANLLKNKREY